MPDEPIIDPDVVDDLPVEADPFDALDQRREVPPDDDDELVVVDDDRPVDDEP